MCLNWLLIWGAVSTLGSQPAEGLFWSVLHPYLATNLKSGSPFVFLGIFLCVLAPVFLFQVVPKLGWEERGVFIGSPKSLSCAN